jgi:hypothetical protein
MSQNYLVDRYGVINQTLTPVSTAATKAVAQTFTVKGLTTDMAVIVNPPSFTDYLSIGGAAVTAADTLSINFINQSSAGLTSASGTYKIHWFKPEHADSAVIL